MHFSFLDMPFEALDLTHRSRLGPLLAEHPHSLSGYTFASLLAWQPIWRYGWCFCDSGTLVVSFRIDREARHLMQPLGRFEAESQERLIAAARALPYPLRIVWVERAFLEAHPDFVRHFEVVEVRDNANYVYRAEDLATLPGRRYAGKRNHIAQAARAYAWTVEKLVEANIDEARHVVTEIRREQEMEASESLRDEMVALETTLQLYSEMEQDGVLVRVDGAGAAFSIFERQTADTAVVHFERALRLHKGMHQVVAQASAQAIAAQGFTFVNREEDMGNPGLRKAKESYHPVRLAEAFELVFKP